MKHMTKLLLCLALTVMLTGCCSHEWEQANCEQPRTCSECGKEEGEKGDHDWEKATCEQPKTCSVCGKEKGDLGDHKWRDATCTEPETCKYCGETRGQPLGHRWVDATCQDCGETLMIPAETVPAEDAPAADAAIALYPETFMLAMLEEGGFWGYTMGNVRENTSDAYVCEINYDGEAAYRVILLLNAQTGRIIRVTVMQLMEDAPVAMSYIQEAIPITMGIRDDQDFFFELAKHRTLQEDNGEEVYEVYEMDGFYIQTWRKHAEDSHMMQVEIFYVG